MATKKKSAASAGNDRKNALDAALAMIEKDFGKGAVMRLGDDNRPPIQSISSGNTAIDVALGIGGWPRGRIVEMGTHAQLLAHGGAYARLWERQSGGFVSA